MVDAAKNIITTDTLNSSNSTKPAQLLPTRKSRELVLGFAAPVGSAVDIVAQEARDQLRSLGYEVVSIKLSELIVKLAENNAPEKKPLLNSGQNDQRYSVLQREGNLLRKRYGNDVLAELAVSKIATNRTSKLSNDSGITDEDPTRTAYLIDQLKHPDEIDLLRTIYGRLFYLIGVFSSSEQRIINLTSNLGIDRETAVGIMETDRKDNIEHGQQLEKALKLSDLFIRNTNGQTDRIKAQLKRFFEVLHGKIGGTPTQHEYAMYVAYSAGLKSACLSRQVGAAITDRRGNIISTGCNDVPQASGGLYTADSNIDNRCYNLEGGKCFNTKHKDKIERTIANTIDEMVEGVDSAQASKIASKIKSVAGLKDLLEFSRSVHAEMDAITSLARVGGSSSRGGFLYTTTYPCHNCARHIIAAGIDKVYYIEPYEKSLARELHRDALELDPEEEKEKTKYVQLLHFEGISPRQYQNFFYPPFDRKEDSGDMKRVNPAKENKIVAELLDGYRDLESKVLEHLTRSQGLPDELFK